MRCQVLFSIIMKKNVVCCSCNWRFKVYSKPALCHPILLLTGNMKYHVNGYIYGNLPDFPACVGEKVALYFMTLNLGIHTMHINGQTMVSERRRWVLLTMINLIIITKTYLYNFDPLKPHFYIVKLGFTGVYIIFLISAQNIDCGYSLEPPRRGGSNEYPQSMFEQKYEKYRSFLSENFQFLEMKFSIYLNRRVFVMWSSAKVRMKIKLYNRHKVVFISRQDY